ncbi:MAG TPA: VWA domain-containing protein [Methanothrix sp.]|nr:VWA domain-containing protein [Methanothrix sp.]HNU40168.1 VWA domain-containing protein [Methanothrix sp.]
MRYPWLILSLAALAILGLYPGMALSISSSESMDEREWMVYSEDNVAFQLAEYEAALSSASASGSERLALIDSSGEESRTSLEMPSGSWTRLRLIPEAGGDLKLFCLYPTGTIAVVLNASVKEDRSYSTWIEAGLEGEYELWFVVDEAKSNSVKIRVREAESMESAPMAGSGILSKALGGGPSISYSTAPAAAAAGPSIGLSAGGAKDISSFRENINNSYLPLPSDLTYEGLFYDYYFETGAAQECNKLFCPSYSYALSRDPFSGERQYYLSLGLNSGIKDFQRKKLNLMVVLDYSGSMGSPFDQYYYDRFGNMVEVDPSGQESSKTKMEIADESVVALLDHLHPDDRFGMVIFSDEAFLLDPLTDMADKKPDRLKSSILGIRETYGTNMEAGMEAGTTQFDRLLPQGGSDYENRIIFLTDAMPNLGETGDLPLYRMLEENARKGIYTTFIGIGVDFNSELVEGITKIRGANYYSVHSAQEFRQRMDDEFDFMVTPLVFDLRLNLDAPGYEIEKVYGSPEADLATGDLMKVNTLFPSQAEEGAVRGGAILVKLAKLSDQGKIRLSASYEDRDGKSDSDEAEVILEESDSDFYQNNGVRKAVLLSRYADLLKNWMIDERTAAGKGGRIVPSVTLTGGIVIPVELGEWERQSLPLTVSDPYPQLFGRFRDYFQVEAQEIGDETLGQEEAILRKLEGTGEMAAQPRS